MNNRLRMLCLASLPVLLADVATADLYQTPLRTVEWLVDNSDVILVVRVDAESRLMSGRVQRVFKGDATTLRSRLKFSDFDGYQYFAPQARSQVRLRFIRGNNEVLLEVDLYRPNVHEDVPRLQQILYGVGQYGNLILTGEDLLRRVVQRIKDGPGTPLPVRPLHHARGRSGVTAPQNFPLETNDYTYVLIVPFTVERRDYFLKLLRTGDALQQRRAVRELAQFDDAKAHSAIRWAASSAKGADTLRFGPGGEDSVKHNSVRIAAARVLEEIAAEQ